MKAEEHQTRNMEIEGWMVRLTSYKLGDEYHCTADNVEPGAWLARTKGATREEAENAAIAKATQLLGRTRRLPVQ